MILFIDFIGSLLIFLDFHWIFIDLDTNEILEYSGARELDNLVKFIEELSDEKVIDDEEDDSEDGKIPEADDKSKHEEL